MPITVSVIMAAYNAEATLERSLRSLLRQTMGDFEILVVNDGSTDGTQPLLDTLSAQDSRIRPLYQPNRGPAAARSLALANISGEYLTFVDADDEVAPEYLETLCHAIRTKKADMAVCAHVRVKGENRMTYAMAEDSFSIEETGRQAFLLHRAVKLGHSIWGKLYRTQIIRAQAIDFFPSRYAEDFCFNLCYYCYCDRVATISDPLYSYYLYDSSLMANIPGDIVPHIARTLEDYNRFVDAGGKREDVGLYYHAVWLQEAFDMLNPASRGGLRGISACLKELDAAPALWHHVKALKGQSIGSGFTIKRTLLTLRPKGLRTLLIWLCMRYLLRNALR